MGEPEHKNDKNKCKSKGFSPWHVNKQNKDVLGDQDLTGGHSQHVLLAEQNIIWGPTTLNTHKTG